MQQQADAILRECRIVETLGKYGDVHLHGSYKLGFMTWPEIDIWILSDDFQSSMAWDIIKDLATAVPPTHVHVINGELDTSSASVAAETVRKTRFPKIPLGMAACSRG
jgi:hypothetical protein